MRHHQLYDGLHRRCIEEVFGTVIICRRGDHNVVRFFICFRGIKRSDEIKLSRRQICLDFPVGKRGFSVIDQIHFFRNDIDGINFMMLRQERGNTESNVSGAGDGNRAIIYFPHYAHFFLQTILTSIL